MPNSRNERRRSNRPTNTPATESSIRISGNRQSLPMPAMNMSALDER